MTRRVVTVDGIDGSGKSTFARRVVAALTAAGSRTVLVRVDDFRRPTDWDSAEEATLYYEQYYDLEALGTAVQAFAAGATVLELPEFDGIAGRSLPPRRVVLAPDTILLIEGVFVRRIPLGDARATHIYLHAPGATARRQLVARDVARGRAPDEIERRLDRRYVPGQTRYHAACDPRGRADILVDNSDTAAPRLVTISPELLPPLLSQVLSQLVPQ